MGRSGLCAYRALSLRFDVVGATDGCCSSGPRATAGWRATTRSPLSTSCCRLVASPLRQRDLRTNRQHDTANATTAAKSPKRRVRVRQSRPQPWPDRLSPFWCAHPLLSQPRGAQHVPCSHTPQTSPVMPRPLLRSRPSRPSVQGAGRTGAFGGRPACGIDTDRIRAAAPALDLSEPCAYERLVAPPSMARAGPRSRRPKAAARRY